MTKKVMPAIRDAFQPLSQIKEVIVQQDGARPHTGKDVVNRLNAIGETMTPAFVSSHSQIRAQI